MKNYVFYISILIIGVISCKNTITPDKHNIAGQKGEDKKKNSENKIKQSNFSKKAIELNKRATLLINERTQISYQKAISLLDEAIRLDTSYYIAYSNKAAALTRLKEYNEAIKVYEHLVTKINQDYPEALTMLGMLYDKTGMDSLAKKYYKVAIQKYSDRIREKEDVMDMFNKAHLIYILDKYKGLAAIDSLINIYPTNEQLPIYKEYMFLNYSHQQALDDL